MTLANIIFLMEMKNKRVELDKLGRRMDMDNGIYVDPNSRSGGLALLWTEEVDINVLFS